MMVCVMGTRVHVCVCIGVRAGERIAVCISVRARVWVGVRVHGRVCVCAV